MDPENPNSFLYALWNNKVYAFYILVIIVISLIIYFVTLLKYEYNKVRDNWDYYKCKFPYIWMGGLIAPDGITDEKGKKWYGLNGNALNYDQCQTDMQSSILQDMLTPVFANYSKYQENIDTHEKSVTNLGSFLNGVDDALKGTYKEISRIATIIYYIIQYSLHKLQMILFKISAVIEVVLDSVTIYFEFITWLIFSAFSEFLLVFSKVFGEYITGTLISGGVTLEAIMLPLDSLLATVLAPETAGASLIFMVALQAVQAELILDVLNYFLNMSSSWISSHTMFNGIGKIGYFPGLDNLLYNPEFDPITGDQDAGSIMNIMKSVSIALKDKNPGCCFEPDTAIIMNDNTTKKIKDCKEGDVLENNNKVIGTIVIHDTQQKMYSYKGILLSGSHYIYENNKLKRASDIGKMSDKKLGTIYCLITDNHKIPVRGDTDIQCADWNDGKDWWEWTDNKDHNYPPCIYEKDLINTPLKDGIGLVKINTELANVKLYTYDGMLCSGTTMILEGKKYINVHESVHSKPYLGKYPEYMYHLLSLNESCKVKNVIIKRFD